MTTSAIAYGSTIRAYDFQPMPGRPDQFIEGVVVDAGMIKHPEYGHNMFSGYTIQITGAARADDPRIGDIGYVPFKMDFMDFDGRIEKI